MPFCWGLQNDNEYAPIALKRFHANGHAINATNTQTIAMQQQPTHNPAVAVLVAQGLHTKVLTVVIIDCPPRHAC
jgi:hypothetical protein